MVAPITQGGNIERVRGWATTLMGTGTQTQGAAVVSQARFVDYRARNAKFIERAPMEGIDDALARLQAARDAETSG